MAVPAVLAAERAEADAVEVAPVSARRYTRRPRPSRGRLWVVAGRRTATNDALVDAFRRQGLRSGLVEPGVADAVARPGDCVLGRLDVERTLDGAEDGLRYLRWLEGRGIRVLNPTDALLASHDKLQTALRLGRLGLPQPATAHLDHGAPTPRLTFPVVVKPRFGSWGADVFLCETPAALGRCLRGLRERTWFRRQGALVQEFVPATGSDLRIVVAGGRVVGAIERVAAAGEWRTNVALGGSRRPVDPPEDACRLALTAADAVGADLVGVDLLPAPGGGHVVLELNGAVDFTSDYSLGGCDVFDEVAAAMAVAFGVGLSLASAGR
jgi:[lysine-biosynthesis-protein LysW]--L-2-aminoadipate ligase